MTNNEIEFATQTTVKFINEAVKETLAQIRDEIEDKKIFKIGFFPNADIAQINGEMYISIQSVLDIIDRHMKGANE